MNTSKAIEALKVSFPQGNLLLPGSEGYEKSNASYYSQLESDIKPAAIFQPRDTAEVSTFLRTLSPLINEGRVAFAVRGGGQQPAEACANIVDGITLDLSLLRGIELKENVVSIGAGERWGAVYEKLCPLGIGVAGARGNNNGIGGLALSGGLSFVSSREGFLCDSVVNFEIALASGLIVNANKNENADLWVALKGGGNNFGVVTRFDYRTFPQGPIWGGSVFYLADLFHDQIQALVDELNKPSASKDTHIMISVGWSTELKAFGSTNMCMNQVYLTQDVDSPPEVLQPFVKDLSPDFLKSKTTVRKIADFVDAATEQTGDSRFSRRTAYMNLTVKADADTLKAAADIYTKHLEKAKSAEELICSFTLQPYSRSLLERSAQSGGNSLGLDPTQGSLVSILLLTFWGSRKDDGLVLSFMKAALKEIRDLATQKETIVPYIYMNYAFADQDPIASYGSENKKRLQEASKKYDPDGIFQKGVPGGWKLFT